MDENEQRRRFERIEEKLDVLVDVANLVMVAGITIFALGTLAAISKKN